jgi:hypothetical protein
MDAPACGMDSKKVAAAADIDQLAEVPCAKRKSTFSASSRSGMVAARLAFSGLN